MKANFKPMDLRFDKKTSSYRFYKKTNTYHNKITLVKFNQRINKKIYDFV